MKKLFIAISLVAIISAPSVQAVNIFQKRVLEMQYRKTDKELNKLQREAGQNPTRAQKREINELITQLERIKQQLK